MLLKTLFNLVYIACFAQSYVDNKPPSAWHWSYQCFQYLWFYFYKKCIHCAEQQAWFIQCICIFEKLLLIRCGVADVVAWDIFSITYCWYMDACVLFCVNACMRGGSGALSWQQSLSTTDWYVPCGRTRTIQICQNYKPLVGQGYYLGPVSVWAGERCLSVCHLGCTVFHLSS